MVSWRFARKRPRLGLALGGGGARGLAHIGVLKVLETHGIAVDFIAGTSIGALVGAAYALCPQTRPLEERALAFVHSPAFRESGLDLFKKKKDAENFFGQIATYVKERVVINLAHSRSSLVGAWRVARTVEFIVPNKTFAEVQIPFVCVATDLTTGQEVVLRQGRLRQAVQASMSIPGFLPPVSCNGTLLVDGAVVAPVPIHACQLLGAEVILAVDVGQGLEGGFDTENVIDIIFRANTITSRMLNLQLLERAHVVVRPEVGHVHWADFREVEALVAAGQRAAEAKLAELRQWLGHGGRWRWWWQR